MRNCDSKTVRGVKDNIEIHINIWSGTEEIAEKTRELERCNKTVCVWVCSQAYDSTTTTVQPLLRVNERVCVRVRKSSARACVCATQVSLFMCALLRRRSISAVVAVCYTICVSQSAATIISVATIGKVRRHRRQRGTVASVKMMWRTVGRLLEPLGINTIITIRCNTLYIFPSLRNENKWLTIIIVNQCILVTAKLHNGRIAITK